LGLIFWLKIKEFHAEGFIEMSAKREITPVLHQFRLLF